MRYKLKEFKVKNLKINKKLRDNSVLLLLTENEVFRLTCYQDTLIDLGDLYLLERKNMETSDAAYYFKYNKDFKTGSFYCKTPEEAMNAKLEKEIPRIQNRLNKVFSSTPEADLVSFEQFQPGDRYVNLIKHQDGHFYMYADVKST